jgi:hypothetical protein
MRRRQSVRNVKTFPTVVGSPSTMCKPSRPLSATRPQCGDLPDRRRQPVHNAEIFLSLRMSGRSYEPEFWISKPHLNNKTTSHVTKSQILYNRYSAVSGIKIPQG